MTKAFASEKIIFDKIKKKGAIKRYKKAFMIFLISLIMTGSIYPNTFASDKWKKDDPITDEWNTIDLMVVRPLGVFAAIAGLGIFSVSLPFTRFIFSHEWEISLQTL